VVKPTHSRGDAPRDIVERTIASLKPYPRNARTHSRKQIRQIAASIERFGFVNPVLVSDADEIIAGHGRVEAAKHIGLTSVPTLVLSHLSDTERRAYILADNKLALNAGWDQELLALELQGLIDLGFEIESTGFSLAEIDFTLDQAEESKVDGRDLPENAVPPVVATAVSQLGDAWRLGNHRLVCGDAHHADVFALLLGNEHADMVFTDPPYNVKIDGNVCGLGTIKHREFAFASGEMSANEFVEFLTATLGNASDVMRDGAIAFVCMDWRHMEELVVAGRACFTELKNLVVWNKTNGGMGAFYRSKHELIFVFKQGDEPHTNSFGLGDTGRYRTNVWDYAGISSIGAKRAEELAMHPTVDADCGQQILARLCSRRRSVNEALTRRAATGVTCSGEMET
jgi:ParB-like chromosome segregation protein Spo0J